jgi:HEPN domain-containing protein
MNTQKLIDLLQNSVPQGWRDDPTNEAKLSQIIDALDFDELPTATEKLEELAETVGNSGNTEFCNALHNIERLVMERMARYNHPYINPDYPKFRTRVAPELYIEFTKKRMNEEILKLAHEELKALQQDYKKHEHVVRYINSSDIQKLTDRQYYVVIGDTVYVIADWVTVDMNVFPVVINDSLIFVDTRLSDEEGGTCGFLSVLYRKTKKTLSCLCLNSFPIESLERKKRENGEGI